MAGPCYKCGGHAPSVYAGQVIPQTTQATNAYGVIPLASHPDCIETYHGQFRSASLLVAGRGTEEETLFARSDYQEAMRFAHGKELTLDSVHVLQLCHDAVVEFLSA